MLGQTSTPSASMSPGMGRLLPATRAQALGWSRPDLSWPLDK